MAKRTFIRWQSAALWNDWKKAGHESTVGDPIAWLSAPNARLYFLVLYGGTKSNLHKCPCWSTFGTKPDDAGLKIIQAHRDIHFYRLGKLKKGSALHIETIKGRRTYEVEYTEILTPAEAEIKIQHAAHRDRLLLMTCYPFRYIGPAPKRYLVWAQSQRIISAINCHDAR